MIFFEEVEYLKYIAKVEKLNNKGVIGVIFDLKYFFSLYLSMLSLYINDIKTSIKEKDKNIDSHINDLKNKFEEERKEWLLKSANYEKKLQNLEISCEN